MLPEFEVRGLLDTFRLGILGGERVVGGGGTKSIVDKEMSPNASKVYPSSLSGGVGVGILSCRSLLSSVFLWSVTVSVLDLFNAFRFINARCVSWSIVSAN